MKLGAISANFKRASQLEPKNAKYVLDARELCRQNIYWKEKIPTQKIFDCHTNCALDIESEIKKVLLVQDSNLFNPLQRIFHILLSKERKMIAESTPFVDYQPIDAKWDQQNYVHFQDFSSPDQTLVPSSEDKIDLKAKKRRKQATQREKRRMEKLNHCIEDIKFLVCPDMKTPTKAKILRVAIDRIQYLEKMTAKLLGQKMVQNFGEKTDQIVPKNLDRMRHSVFQKPASVPVSDSLTMENYVPPQPVNHVVNTDQAQRVIRYAPETPPPVDIEYVYYNQEIEPYSPKLAEFPSMDSVQMGENSNSADSFGENGEFLAPVSSSPLTQGIQIYDENSIDANYYTADTPFNFSYE